MQRGLDYCKLIWRNRDESIKDRIVQSLYSDSIDTTFSQALYMKSWRELIKKEKGIDVNPLDYLRAFSYKTFSEYWEAINGES